MEGKRTANFSSEEEQLLIALVDKYKNIVESKKTGNITWTDKEKAWKKIEEEFNASNGRSAFRTVKNLKEKYNNLKKKTKKKFATDRLNFIKTGGGACTPVTVTEVDIAIKNIIGKQVDGLKNIYDCDNMLPVIHTHSDVNSDITVSGPTHSVDAARDNTIKNVSPSYEQSHIMTKDYFDACDDIDNIPPEEEVTNNWSKYSAAMLSQPVSQKLKVNIDKAADNFQTRKCTTKKSNITKKYVSVNQQLIEEKIDFVRFQKEKLEEEHELKMKLMKKKLELVEAKLKNIKK